MNARLATVAAILLAVAGAVSAISSRDLQLGLLGMISAGVWLIVSYLAPVKPPAHEHDWDWNQPPHPVSGQRAAVCRTCGTTAVF